MGAAGGDAGFGDGGAAAGAWLAFAAKDICEAKIAAFFAFGIHIVFIGTATFLNR